jgi:hypothetical protein
MKYGNGEFATAGPADCGDRAAVDWRVVYKKDRTRWKSEYDDRPPVYTSFRSESLRSCLSTRTRGRISAMKMTENSR